MVEKGQILLVDDEPSLIRSLRPTLHAAGYDVTVKATGLDALAHLASEVCDAVILDLDLPDIDGKTIIGRVREWSLVPIVVLSARDSEDEKVTALDLGADDFVNKPFAVRELLARLRAALRGRLRREAARSQFVSSELRINFAERRVFLHGAEVRLTPREYSLLRVLARHVGQVVTHRQISMAVWSSQDGADPQAVRVLIGHLRQRLSEPSSAPRLIVTEPGIGYRLMAEEIED